MRTQRIIITHRAAGQTARNWGTAAKIIGVLVALGLVIQYWYLVLAVAAIAGASYLWNERRKTRIAKHAACLAEIARMEREMGIG